MKKVLILLILTIYTFTFSAIANPNRIFSVDKTEGSGPLTVKFDARNIKPAKKFYWSFGNGEVLTTENPIVSYTFKTPGTYTVSLKFAVNASDKELKNLKDAGDIQINVLGKVNVAPTASISCSTNYMLVTCNALASFDPEGQPLSYQFLYSDGFIESNTNGLSSHAFSSAGLYSVKLIVTDNANATSEVITQVLALSPQNLLPVLALNCFSNELNTLICNANGSYDPDGTIFAFRYEWDDNSFDVRADSSNFSHFFNSSGNHTVTLKAVDDKGGVSSITKSFEVKANSAPIATFECTNTGVGSVHCNSTSFDQDGFIFSSKWTLDDGTVIEGFGFDHTFLSGDTHLITLTITDNLGAKTSIAKFQQLLINQSPTFDLITSTTSGFVPLTVNFRADNIVDDGSVTSVEWDFGDNETATGAEVSHSFFSAGTYNVVAKVTDDQGGVTTKTVSIVVQDIPFMANLECTTNNLFVMCNALGTYNPNGFPLIYSFNYDDGFVETNTTGLSSHGYSAAGSYNVKLTVTNGLGLSSEKSIIVMPVLPDNILPVATISCKAEGVLQVTCNTQASDEDGVVSSVVYIFDDGVVLNSSPGVEISRTFASAGEHLISAVAVDFDGGNSLLSSTVVTVVDEILEDGIFIGGVDSIDLNPHEKFGEYFFNIYKRENGQVDVLEEQNITLQEAYPGLEIINNILQVKTGDYFEEIPNEITMNATVEGVKYSKTISISKKVSKLIGTIPAGNLTTFTIQDEKSVLKGTTLKFDDGQITEREMQIYETELDDGVIAFNFEQSNEQPISYKILIKPENLEEAFSSKYDLNSGLFEIDNLIFYFEDNAWLDSHSTCSNNTSYFVEKDKVVIDNKFDPSPEKPNLFYDYNKSIYKDLNSFINAHSSAHAKVRNVIASFSDKFMGINFVFQSDKPNILNKKIIYAHIEPLYKNTVYINLATIGRKSSDYILGTLIHEKRHLEQVATLGCNLFKMSYSNSSVFLESEAEYSVYANNQNLDFVNTYLMESNFSSVRYSSLIGLYNGMYGLNNNIEGTAKYMLGMIWDHLSFDRFSKKIKENSIDRMNYLIHDRPSAFLLELFGDSFYFDFTSEFMVSFYYPSSTLSFYTRKIASLYQTQLDPSIATTQKYLPTENNEIEQVIPSVSKNIVLFPLQSELNVIDYQELTKSIPDTIKKSNLRFRFFIFPSDDEYYLEGFENVFTAFSSKGDKSSRVKEVLWSGNGSEPSKNEFILDFNKFDFNANQVQLLLSNGDREKIVRVDTILVTEMKKRICYYSTGERGTESLRVTFMQKGDAPLGDYPYRYIDKRLSSGQCEEFYLAYNVPYFYEFLVAPATVIEDIAEFGLYTSWDYEREDFAYNFNMNNLTGLKFNADLVPINEYYYKIKLDVQETADGTIYIAPLY